MFSPRQLLYLLLNILLPFFIVLYYVPGDCYYDCCTYDCVFHCCFCHYSGYKGPPQGPPRLQLSRVWLCHHHWSHRTHLPHHCAAATASVQDAFAGICQLCHGSPTGKFFFQNLASHQFFYICWCSFWCVLSISGSTVNVIFNLWELNHWGLHHCRPLEHTVTGICASWWLSEAHARNALGDCYLHCFG